MSTSSYFVCGVPRSGTSLLCDLLASTGVAGRPQEYFWREDEAENRRRWDVSSDRQYLEEVLRRGTTENGVFGSKLMWHYFGELLWSLRSLDGRAPAADAELLARFFPKPRYLWIWRDDVVAQAVSWSKAIQDDQWASHQECRGEASFDFAQIDGLVREAKRHRLAWERWFTRNGVEPFGVSYEELTADWVGVTRRALRFLGLPADDVERAQPATRLQKQADERNELWAQRYRAASDAA
jgi:LPS sulfotransferase NodH